MDWWWLLVPASYLLGALPTAHAIGRLTGNDPSAEGSGNPGASNMYRVAGRSAGVAVLVGDVLKGFIPAAVGFAAGGRSLAVACGIAAMLGHVAPVTRGFRGGKGVATLGGACVFLYPAVSAILLLIWLLTMKVLRTASVGSLVLALGLPIGIALAGYSAWEVVAMSLACGVVVARHWSNIVRIVRRQEHAIT